MLSQHHWVQGCWVKTGRKDGSYLLCESDIKAGLFIMYNVKSISVSHILVPKNAEKYLRQSLEEAVAIASVIISSSDSFKHQVPAVHRAETWRSRLTGEVTGKGGHSRAPWNTTTSAPKWSPTPWTRWPRMRWMTALFCSIPGPGHSGFYPSYPQGFHICQTFFKASLKCWALEWESGGQETDWGP